MSWLYAIESFSGFFEKEAQKIAFGNFAKSFNKRKDIVFARVRDYTRPLFEFYLLHGEHYLNSEQIIVQTSRKRGVEDVAPYKKDFKLQLLIMRPQSHIAAGSTRGHGAHIALRQVKSQPVHQCWQKFAPPDRTQRVDKRIAKDSKGKLPFGRRGYLRRGIEPLLRRIF